MEDVLYVLSDGMLQTHYVYVNKAVNIFGCKVYNVSVCIFSCRKESLCLVSESLAKGACPDRVTGFLAMFSGLAVVGNG